MSRLPFLGLLLASAIAVAPAAASEPVSTATAQAITQFYVKRGSPLWLAQPEAVRTLLAALRDAPIDGFAEGPELADGIERVLVDVQAGVPYADREAERQMSVAFLAYLQQLHRPLDGVIFADPRLEPQKPDAAALLAEAAASDDLAAFVRRRVELNPIYASLRQGIRADLRFLGQPSRAMSASLDRARVLPSSGRWVMVDIPSQTLFMMEDGKAVDRMKVVVGKPAMKTPLMAGTLRQVTFNPYWNVPVDLAAIRIAPAVLANGVGWFKSRGYEILSGFTHDATVLDPETVDWKAIADGRTEARVRQKPGGNNMMGDMKFQFPNEHGIYLHDTPERGRFDEAQRAASSGCVRLEDAARLGRWLLGREPKASSDRPEYQVPLTDAVPVFLTYLTVQPGERGGLAYAPDIYGLDKEPEEKVATLR